MDVELGRGARDIPGRIEPGGERRRVFRVVRAVVGHHGFDARVPEAVVVTHEMGFARQVADMVVFMDGGRIVESGPPAQVLDHPTHDRTRAFLSKVL